MHVSSANSSGQRRQTVVLLAVSCLMAFHSNDTEAVITCLSERDYSDLKVSDASQALYRKTTGALNGV